MRIARSALIAATIILCAPAGASAQVSATPATLQNIEWSASRRLSLQDFKGEVPDAAKYQSRSWIRIESSWRCISGTLITSISAVFDPARSWWLGSQWNPWEDVDNRRRWISRTRNDVENKRHIALSEADLLRHEQLHFDLAELTARKIRQRLADLPAPCAMPDRDASVEKIVVQMTDEFGKEQVLYDDETAHGTKAPLQQQWEARVQSRKEKRERLLPN